MAFEIELSDLNGLAERARAMTDADRCTIYEVDADRGEIFSRVALELENQEIRLPLRRGIIGHVARTGHSLRLRDAHNDPRFDPTTDERTGYVTRSVLCVPVLNSRGDVRGAIQVINKREGPFSEEDEAALNALTPEVAVLLR